MTPLFWIVLLLIVAAVAYATVTRKRPAARISAAQRAPSTLPPRDELAGLGLSSVRAATPRPDGVPVPVSQPVAQPVARPVGSTPAPSAWIEDALDETPAATLPAAETVEDDPLDAERLDPSELDVPAVEAQVEMPTEAPRVSSPEDVEDTLRADAHAEAEAPAAPEEEDTTVWTFDHDAAASSAALSETSPEAPAAASRAEYVRDGQALWPDGAAAPTLLAASLAARLGGSVAVLRHDGADYLVELLVGDAAAGLAAGAAPEAVPAEGHPLHRVPQDGVLSLLGAGAAMPYHVAPRQTLVQTLAEPPHARVLLVADVPPGAPDVDGTTAALVSGYADLLAGLTHVPLAPDDGPAWPPGAPALPDLPDADEAPMHDEERLGAEAPDASNMPDTEDAAATENAVATEAPAETPAEAAVARPGAGRAAPRTSRGIILTGEIDAARRDRRLLVFALVTLADAEAIIRAGDAGVVRAEAALRQRLTAARAVRRVEPFGSLLFGVFLDAEGPEVVTWAERVSGQGHPLLVGAVAAVGSEEAVRAAATDALQSAYEREAVCVVAA